MNTDLMSTFDVVLISDTFFQLHLLEPYQLGQISGILELCKQFKITLI